MTSGVTYMEVVPRPDVSDKYSWWCRHCKGRKSIRWEVFSSNRRLVLEKKHKYLYIPPHQVTLQKWLLVTFLWAREYLVSGAAKDSEVSQRMTIDVYQWFREVCTKRLLITPIVLGGPGVIVNPR